jgi:hypothetical protein
MYLSAGPFDHLVHRHLRLKYVSNLSPSALRRLLLLDAVLEPTA